MVRLNMTRNVGRTWEEVNGRFRYAIDPHSVVIMKCILRCETTLIVPIARFMVAETSAVTNVDGLRRASSSTTHRSRRAQDQSADQPAERRRIRAVEGNRFPSTARMRPGHL